MQLAASFSHCPMNSSHCQNPGTRSNRRRVAATLSLSLLVSFSVLPAAAQRKQKRITSVWTTTTAEGSRVHVVSNSPVNDYEGYTRGGRFYVKIPLADLPSARGSLLGRGFDDVQIQRYGDGIIISFRLQPGTTARVEQSTNRLDIVFSTLAGARSALSASSNVDAANRIRGRRIAGAPGPSLSSSLASRQPPSRKPATLKQRVTSSSAGLKDTASNTAQDRGSRSSEATASSRPNELTSSASPAPGSSPSAAASPTASANVSDSSASATPGTPVSQAAPASRQTSSPSTAQTAAGSGDNDWRSRAYYWRVWAELNWVPLLIGGLIGLALLILLVFRRGTKRARTEVKPATAPASTKAIASKQLASPARSSDAGETVSASQSATGSGGSSATGQTHSPHPLRRATDKNAGEEHEREVIEL